MALEDLNGEVITIHIEIEINNYHLIGSISLTSELNIDILDILLPYGLFGAKICISLSVANRNFFFLLKWRELPETRLWKCLVAVFCWVGVCAKPARRGLGSRRAVIGKPQNDTLNPAWSD